MRFKPRQTFSRALFKTFEPLFNPKNSATMDKNRPVRFKIPKPNLRGLHQATIKRNITLAVLLAATAVTALKIFRNEPRKRDYIEFYKYYDDNEAFERMKEAGLMQSIQPGMSFN